MRLNSFILILVLIIAVSSSCFALENFGVELVDRVLNQWDKVYNLEVRGDYIYLATAISGLQIVNKSNLDSLYITGYYDFNPDETRDLALDAEGSYAYLADRLGGLLIVDVSDPANPNLVSSISTEGSAEGLFVLGEYAYIANGMNGGLVIVNISNPEEPSISSRLETEGMANDVYVAGNYAYFANGAAGLRIIDISSPEQPQQVGVFDTPGDCYSVEIHENLAYIADGREGGLRIVDISTRNNPQEVGSFDTPGYAYYVTADSAHAYIGDGGSGMRIVDVSDPAEPEGVGFLPVTSRAYGIEVVDDIAFVAGYEGGVVLVNTEERDTPEERNVLNTNDGWAVEFSRSNQWWGYLANNVEGFYQVSILPDSLIPSPRFRPYNSKIKSIKSRYYPPWVHYLGCGEEGFQISSGQEIGILNTNNAMKVQVEDTLAFIADGRNGGLKIIDVSNRLEPVLLGHFPTNSEAWGANDISVSGQFAYLSDGNDGLRIIDISNLEDPIEIGHYEIEGNAISVRKYRDHAFLVEDNSANHPGIHIIDVTDPESPNLVSFLHLQNAIEVAVYSNYMYVGAGKRGLYIFNIHYPRDPHLVGYYDTPGFAFEPAANHGLYIPDGSSLLLLDVSEALNANIPPSWSEYPDSVFQAEEGVEISFGLTAVDPDEDDEITLEMLWDNAPDSAQFTDNGNGRGTFRWNINYESSGEHNPRFVAADGELADTITVTILVDNDESLMDGEAAPAVFQIANVYPNPFNSQITFEFTMPWQNEVEIALTDLLGRRIRKLTTNRIYPVGVHQTTIDAVDLPAGIYILSVSTNGFTELKRLALVK